MKIDKSNVNDLLRLSKLTLINKKAAINSLEIFNAAMNKMGLNLAKAKADILVDILKKDVSEDALNLGQGIPAIVSLSLAIECALKARSLVDHGSFPKDHDLEKLYNHIPQKIRVSITERICDKMNITDAEFDAKLHSNRDHFVGMRYMESTPQELNADFDFLLALLDEFTPMLS